MNISLSDELSLKVMDGAKKRQMTQQLLSLRRFRIISLN